MNLKITIRFITFIFLFHSVFPQNKLSFPLFETNQINTFASYCGNPQKNLSNSGFHVITVTTSNWQNGKWSKSSLITYDYGKNNSILSEFTKTWNGLKWNDSLRVLYSYDSLNREIEVLHQRKNNNDWINVTRERSEIWSTESKLMYHEEFTGGVWSISWMETVSQNKSGKFRQILLHNSGGYSQIGRSYELYNELGNITESAFYWTMLYNEVLTSMDKYYYDSLNRLIKIGTEHYGNDGLEEYIKNICEYNEQNNSSIKIRYDKKDSVWLPFERYTSLYDENDNEILLTKEVYETGVWKNATREEKTYEKLLKNEDVAQIPENYILFQNYPNPFNPTTIIKFSLPNKSKVKLMIYDLMGKEVETLVDNVLSSGEHEVKFNAAKLSSGIYFYKLRTPSITIIKKMLLAK
jgi:hypothetical protein